MRIQTKEEVSSQHSLIQCNSNEHLIWFGHSIDKYLTHFAWIEPISNKNKRICFSTWNHIESEIYVQTNILIDQINNAFGVLNFLMQIKNPRFVEPKL